MASTSRRMVASVLLVLLLLVATEMGTMRVAEARHGHRHCESQSHRYRGACWRDDNCEHVCNTEGFPWGKCKFHDFERKCFCKRPC
uniref:Defensin n=1 Tax=Triticum turgidum subsp. durum TaxID=4567 RepID=C9E1C5_TRITD|nr:defensin precursor [Triticum turgidum subsp. durum]